MAVFSLCVAVFLFCSTAHAEIFDLEAGEITQSVYVLYGTNRQAFVDENKFQYPMFLGYRDVAGNGKAFTMTIQNKDEIPYGNIYIKDNHQPDKGTRWLVYYEQNNGYMTKIVDKGD